MRVFLGAWIATHSRHIGQSTTKHHPPENLRWPCWRVAPARSSHASLAVMGAIHRQSPQPHRRRPQLSSVGEPQRVPGHGGGPLVFTVRLRRSTSTKLHALLAYELRGGRERSKEEAEEGAPNKEHIFPEAPYGCNGGGPGEADDSKKNRALPKLPNKLIAALPRSFPRAIQAISEVVQELLNNCAGKRCVV